MRRNCKSTIDYRLSIIGIEGQSLIEVVVSSGIAVLLAIALITTGLITQKSARIAKNNTRATKLAQETLEQIRVFRDRRGFSALPVGNCYILQITPGSASDPANWNLTSCNYPEIVGLEGGNFTRKMSIQIPNNDANNKLVTVTVSWTESGEDKKVSSQTILSNWESSPNP